MSWLDSSGQPVARGVIVLGVIAASVFLIVLQIRWMEEQDDAFLDAPIQQFSRIIDQQTLRVLCDICEGSGLVRELEDPDKMAICDHCFGLGVHRVRQVRYTDVLCPDCRGMGRVAAEGWNHADPCRKCYGRGLVTVSAQRYPIHAKNVPCRHCDGRGVVRNPENEDELLTCPVCFGLGGNVVRLLDDREEYCITCDGMGRLVEPNTGKAYYCERCGGRGIRVSEESELAVANPAAGAQPAPPAE